MQVAADLEAALNAPGSDLIPAALAIARVEYPALDPRPYMDAIDEMGLRAAGRLGELSVHSSEAIAAFNEFLYEEEGFSGNRTRYEDRGTASSTR